MPIAVSDDQRSLASAVRSWAQRAQPTKVARTLASEPGAWRALWSTVGDLGLVTAAARADLGGGGASPADQAVLLEAAAGALVPGPVLSSALAALVLSEAGCAEPLAAVVAGAHVGVALDAPDLSVQQDEAGSAVLRGTVRPVLGADATSWLLLPVGDQWAIIAPDPERVKVLDLEPVDLSCPVAEVTVDDVAVPASHLLTGIAVRDLAATLASAEASGVATWCLDTAVAYAKVREQFGRPIGSFQSIKHLCAQMLCRRETASAVAWDAAVAEGEEHSLAAAVAAAIALDAAVDNAKDCIQVLGGIGFTWEHDAHLYLRRALALRQWLGGSATWRRRVAELTAAGDRRTLRIDLSAVESARPPVRTTAEHIASLPVGEQRDALTEAGLLAPHWPAPYGRGAGPAEQLLIDEELARAGVTRPDLVIAGWAIPTILDHGTAAQIERFVRPTLLGDITWCQLFSEPEAGSDLASLRTRATKVDGGWQLTGQKVWTSLAHRADWGICLARTNPDAKKHKGISYFLVDMRAPGVDVRPLLEIVGEPRFNEVFLDDVFVPDDCLVGEAHDGWRLARTTLAHERVAIGTGSAIGEDTERLVQVVADGALLADSAIAERLGALVADGLAGSLLDVRGALKRLDGSTAGAESSMRKLVGVAHRQNLADFALDLAGPEAIASSEEAHGVLLARCLSIAGGTTQVLLSVAAEQLLGLPRD